VPGGAVARQPLAKIPVLPFGRLVRWLAGLNGGWGLAVPIAIVAAIGLAFAVMAILKAGRLVISDTQLCYDFERRAKVAARSDVAVVYTPELPATVNAVLAARQIAVERRSHRDAEDLGEAVQKLGYVVRTDGRAQFWRPLVQP
jgi:hypothetical protein